MYLHPIQDTMPRISHTSLGGHLLEEALAYLIRRSGYTLLVDVSQDPETLANRGNGLVVKGRGGEHQVDVLGELDWIPAFTFPLRLFLEAKFRREKTGIPSVRNAVGVLADLNQRYARTSKGPLVRRFRYAYTLFSTSGFTAPAASMAFAHEISLVDLSGRDYQSLRDAVTSAAESILGPSGPRIEPETPLEETGSETGGRLIASMREVIREELGTNPLGPRELQVDPLGLKQKLDGLITATKETGDLFVGMASGPYMLAIKSSNKDAFLGRMRRDPVLNVRIHWSTDVENGRRWVMIPTDGDGGFELSFSVPEDIGDWVFSEEGGSVTKALSFKRRMLPHIFIPFRDENGRDSLFRLDYDDSDRRGG